MPLLVSVPFQELDLIPDQDGYSAACRIDGNAVVSWSNGDWWIESIEIAVSKTVLDHSKPFQTYKSVLTKTIPATDPIKGMAIRALCSSPDRRAWIRESIDSMLRQEPVNENQYAEVG